MSDDTPSRADELPACPDCGGPVASGERFCQSCGVRLVGADPEGTSDAVAHRPDETTELRHDAAATARQAPATARQRPAAVATAGATSSGLRRCPSCAAPNSAQRELCGRCGADLDTGTIPPRPERRAPDPEGPAEPVEEEHHGRYAWWAVAAVLAVAAAVVAGLAIAGIGPFDRGPAVPPAVFEGDRYDGDPEFLPLSDIATLTTLPPSGTDRYDATQMVDDDRSTAWNSDGSQLPDGVGEKIDLFLAEPAWVDQIVFANGDQRDPDTYAANARIQRAQLTLDGGMTVVINLLDQGLQQQVVELRQPELTTTVRIEVLETFPGDTHPDLAVSDIELRGWVADEGDAELAEERATARRAAGPSTDGGTD